MTDGQSSRAPWILAWISNYANPVYGVGTICHQVRCLRWGHPSLFHTATSLLIWYTMFCMRDISYRLIWMKFINMLPVYAQCGTHRRFNWWIIAVLTLNPPVLMCMEITDAPKLWRKYVESWIFVAVLGQWPLGKNIRGSSYCIHYKVWDKISYSFPNFNGFQSLELKWCGSWSRDFHLKSSNA